MTNPKKYHAPDYYRIKLNGRLDPKWSDWFEKMTICGEGGQTVLEGLVADQAALHGLLTRIGDLNLTLISVERVQPKPKDKPLSNKEER